ncbi:MAG: PmoA family protein [Planctomycetes bacterium]|nr:PmoA family protein [Planctomycetota bacterium]
MLLRRSVVGSWLACALLAGACRSPGAPGAPGTPGTPGPPGPPGPPDSTSESQDPSTPASVSATADGYVFAPGGRALARYERGARSLKPYLASLVGADGVELLRDAPPDHEHHHGLMFALGVDDVDFWGERYADVPGRQVELNAATFGIRALDRVASAGLAQTLAWLDPRDESPLLCEWRELALDLAPRQPEDSGAPQPTSAPWTFTWRSRLTPGEGRERVRLWGRPYFGLGLRLAAPFDCVARFTHSDAQPSELVRGDERLTSGRWCAISADVAGTPRTLALFASPTNPRATRFFTMAEPFAYLSATLDLAREPLELTRDTPLELTYGLCLWERDVTERELEVHYADWAARNARFGFGTIDFLEALGVQP